ncbi:hybrid sensor histidine kinase/response regulator [Fulvivirga sp. RKSG066]|uniref:response regulator n=1 Tax=Fulvivirga aurantia TaxID=2529383 RepID=UPI0012BC2100|nr:response regulator [Fulvivirga aurantia]MTI20413.1 hybrid sensor histidine kinase/response regulator [Fulvivirga aurantia]
MNKQEEAKLDREKERLEAIQEYNVESNNPILDDLVILASHICKTEISLVTLLDKDVQWFKAKHGIEPNHTPREVAFCNIAIDGKEILEIEDTHRDERFISNPLVTGEPHIRFYAGAPIINYKGFPLGTLCVIDSKPKKLTQEQRESLTIISRLVVQCLDKDLREQKATEALQFKSDLLNLMSQEMLSPMNNIIGLIEMIASEGADTKENIGDLRSSAEKLHGLINNMLDFHNVKEGKISPQEIPFDLDAIVRNLRNTAKPRLDEKNIKLKLNYDLSIPDTMLGDPQRVEQVLGHLIDFAYIHSEEGNLKLNTEIVDEGSKEIVVRFTSTFPGEIQKKPVPENSKDLFDENGDSVARDLIKMLGGKLVIKSKKGKTSATFSLRFRKSKDQGLKSPAKKKPGLLSDFKGVKVLLVDDLETNRIILGKFLEKWGIKFDTANDGQQAIDLALKNEYALILMDLRMPVVDGFEATRQIKLKKEVPIIALTASLSTFDDDAYINSTIDDLLAKPFHPMDLKQKIHSLLKSRVGLA